MARLTYKPTVAHTKRIRDMLKADVPVEKICHIMGFSENLFYKNYQPLLEKLGVKRGGPAFVPTEVQRNTVKMLAALGTPQEQIAKFIAIGNRTLAKYFRPELDLGAIQANMQVGGNLFKMATGVITDRNTAIAAIWWSKTRMHWKDTSRLEMTGPDGAPIKHENQVQIVLPDNGRQPELTAGNKTQLIESGYDDDEEDYKSPPQDPEDC
jgi:hypothetical protein